MVPVERRRHLAAVIFGGLAACVLLLLPIGSASAHSQLESSIPAAGARLDSVPTEVTLTFSEDIAPGLSQVGVTDGEGLTMTRGKPATDGAVVTQALHPNLLPGTYTVTYKVTSADGHPVSDAFTFIVNVGAAGSTPASRGTPTSDRTPTSGGTQTSDGTQGSSTAGSPSTGQASGSAALSPGGTTAAGSSPSANASGATDGGSSGLRNLSIAALVAALFVIAWTVRARRRH